MDKFFKNIFQFSIKKKNIKNVDYFKHFSKIKKKLVKTLLNLNIGKGSKIVELFNFFF